MPLPSSRARPALRVGALACVAALLGAALAHGQSPAKPDPRADIATRLDVTLDAIRPSALPGIFEVARGGEVVYVSSDGRYALSGDLYETGSGKNLTEKRRTEARYAALKAVPDADAIIFTPPSPRYTVTVFTDVDCAFCRRLHSDIAEYNRLGVRVRYLPFPRTGPGTDSWRKAEAVWCAPDRREALTRAKAGRDIPGKGACAPTPVARYYELGEELGIRGTPGIFTERGEYLPGYYTPAKLIERLKQLEAAAGTG
ncbi:MAG TPA: DsbC family protein [Steroidobacteraceae bacterium]|nr:DsbC family protein [Steroidobacteraceae bacterium]